jgi:uncharacterized coiled-coil DUF342 family protein
MMESTQSDALVHLRANRVLLARRINEIARRMVDLRTELETLDEEMKAKARQLKEVERGIRALRARNSSARPAGRVAHMSGDSSVSTKRVEGK